MTVVVNISKSVARNIARTIEGVRAVESVTGGLVGFLFNGVDQYLSVPPVTLSGSCWEHSLKYTPDADDIGLTVTLLAGLLTKNASDQLVVTYTDVGAVVQTITLTAQTLVVDTEYEITVASDGTGVTLTSNGVSATDTAIADHTLITTPAAMADAGGTGGHSNATVRDILITDNGLPSGTYAVGDGVNVRVDIPRLTFPAAFSAELTFVWAGQGYLAGDRDSSSPFDRLGLSGGSALFGFGYAGHDFGAFNLGQTYKIEIVRDSDFNQFLFLDELLVDGALKFDTYSINALMSPHGGSTSIPHWTGPMTAKFTSGGSTYEYLTAGSVSAGGTATNTGDSGPSFDGTMVNWLSGTDTAAIVNQSRSYPLSTSTAAQPNALAPGTDDAVIVNYGPPLPVSLPLDAEAVFIGDSITNGNQANYNCWWQWMQQEGGGYFYLSPTANQGVSGETTTQIATRMASYVGNPDVVFLLMGENDNSSVTLQTMQANFEAIFTRFSAATRIYVIPQFYSQSVDGNSTVNTRRNDLNIWLTAINSTYSNVWFLSDALDNIDVFDGGVQGPDTYDGIHLNVAGARKLGEDIWQLVKYDIEGNGASDGTITFNGIDQSMTLPTFTPSGDFRVIIRGVKRAFSSDGVAEVYLTGDNFELGKNTDNQIYLDYVDTGAAVSSLVVDLPMDTNHHNIVVNRSAIRGTTLTLD